MSLTHTRTYATLEVSKPAFDEIAKKLREARYDHAFQDGLIDMYGIALKEAPKRTVQSDGHGGGMGGHDDDINPLTDLELHDLDMAAGLGDFGTSDSEIYRAVEEIRWLRAKLRTRNVEVETYYNSFALTKEAYNRLRRVMEDVKGVVTDAVVDMLNKALMTEKECRLFKPEPQHCASALVYLREAVLALREQRDKHADKTNKYDALVCAARNIRDLFEWLYPLVWLDDPEFVPFNDRTPANDWGKAR